MSLTIPDSDKPAFKMLLSLSPEQMQALIDALTASKPARYLRELAEELSTKVQVTLGDLYEIVKLLGFLSWLQSVDEMESDDLVNDLVATLESDPTFSPAGRDWANFRADLQKILRASNSLRITSKASEILAESERRLCPDSCRIVSEVRPIFPDDPSGKPDAAVVVHTLKIAYHNGSEGDLKEFFVDLESDDLDAMASLIDRASIKQDSLKSLIEGSGIYYLGPKREPETE